MASVVLSGDTSGTITVSAPAVSGSNTQTLVAATGTLAPLISGTAVTASGTSVDFTSIPSWVKRITVMFQGVSTSGTSNVIVQLGAGSVTTSGYSGYNARFGAASNAYTALSSGFLLENANSATTTAVGALTLVNITGNTFVCTGMTTNSGSANESAVVSGSIALSGTLDRVRITTVNGTDTFDAGTINILYE
jgi:hypothetical protein